MKRKLDTVLCRICWSRFQPKRNSGFSDRICSTLCDLQYRAKLELRRALDQQLRETQDLYARIDATQGRIPNTRPRIAREPYYRRPHGTPGFPPIGYSL